MRDRIYYILAIAVLMFAIVALVMVLGQNQPTVSQETTAGENLQSLFTSVAARVNSDAGYSVRIRVAALSEGSAITISQAETRISEVGADYFCLSSTNPGRVCYPYSQLLAIAVPG